MRRYCPICEKDMPLGNFCKDCFRFVTPMVDKGNYYLNRPHIDNKQHRETCQFHNVDTNYSNKPTYSVNETNSDSYNPQKKKAAANTYTRPVTYTKRNDTYQSKTHSTVVNGKAVKKKTSNKIGLIIFLVIVLFQFIPVIISTAGHFVQNIVESDFDFNNDNSNIERDDVQSLLDNEYLNKKGIKPELFKNDKDNGEEYNVYDYYTEDVYLTFYADTNNKIYNIIFFSSSKDEVISFAKEFLVPEYADSTFDNSILNDDFFTIDGSVRSVDIGTNDIMYFDKSGNDYFISLYR